MEMASGGTTLNYTMSSNGRDRRTRKYPSVDPKYQKQYKATLSSKLLSLEEHTLSSFKNIRVLSKGPRHYPIGLSRHDFGQELSK